MATWRLRQDAAGPRRDRDRTPMRIRLKRAYEPAIEDDGFRVLVERLWPRGVSREEARIDLWTKEAAPSNELRRWYGHDPTKWEEFRRRYFAELEAHPEVLDELRARLAEGPVTFVFASKETTYNCATALAEYLTSDAGGSRGASAS